MLNSFGRKKLSKTGMKESTLMLAVQEQNDGYSQAFETIVGKEVLMF